MIQGLKFLTPPTQMGTEYDLLLDIFRPYAPPFESKLLNADGRFTWSADVAAVTNCISCWRIRHNGETSMLSESSEDRMYVMFPIEGAFGVQLGAHYLSGLKGSALIIPGNELELGNAYSLPFHSCYTLKFDREVLRRIVRSLFGETSLKELQIRPLVDLTSPGGKILHHLAVSIFGTVYGFPSFLQTSKAMPILCEALLFHIFEHFTSQSKVKVRHTAEIVLPRNIRTAIEFMHANMHHSITLQDIADASHSSVRAIHAGFKLHKGMTPMAYLRNLRLEAAHAELSSRATLLSVKQVAAKWGFFHYGRFAAYYREVYGEYPSETVQS